jgi:hypothetical protein
MAGGWACVRAQLAAFMHCRNYCCWEGGGIAAGTQAASTTRAATHAPHLQQAGGPAPLLHHRLVQLLHLFQGLRGAVPEVCRRNKCGGSEELNASLASGRNMGRWWRRQKQQQQRAVRPPTRVPRRVELLHLLAGAPVGAPPAAPHAVAALERRRHGRRAAQGPARQQQAAGGCPGGGGGRRRGEGCAPLCASVRRVVQA